MEELQTVNLIFTSSISLKLFLKHAESIGFKKVPIGEELEELLVGLCLTNKHTYVYTSEKPDSILIRLKDIPEMELIKDPYALFHYLCASHT